MTISYDYGCLFSPFPQSQMFYTTLTLLRAGEGVELLIYKYLSFRKYDTSVQILSVICTFYMYVL